MRICSARHFRSRRRPAYSRRARSSGPRRAAGRAPFRARRRRSRARAATPAAHPSGHAEAAPGPKREAQRPPRRRQSAKRNSSRGPPRRGAQRPGGERDTRGRASRWHSTACAAGPRLGTASPSGTGAAPATRRARRAARGRPRRLDRPVDRHGGGRLDREVRRRSQVGEPRAPAPATSCKNRRPARRTRPAVPRAAIPSATESHSGFHIQARFRGRRVAKSGTFPLLRTRRPSPSRRNPRSERRAI